MNTQGDLSKASLPSKSEAFKADTAKHPYHFRGWVPAVSGRLSFRAFGQSSFPTKAVSANRSDGKTSYIVCYQRRDASDVVLPFKSALAPLMLKLKGDFYFVCIAKTVHHEGRKQEFLDGWLILFENTEVWKNHVAPMLKELQDHIRKYRAYSLSCSLDDHVTTKYQATINRAKTLSSFNAQFSLSRSGTVSIAVPLKPVVSSKAPAFPKDAPNRGHMMHLLSAQLFFFLRDIGHRHQHHDPKTDTISDLHRIDKIDDDFNWRLGTLYSMYRKVIDLKRAPHSDTLANAMGVIAYAETFENICKDELDKRSTENLPTYYNEQTKESISAAKSALELRYAENVRKRDGLRSLLLSILGAVFAFVALLSLAEGAGGIKAHPVLLGAAKMMLVHPFECLFLVIFLYVVYGRVATFGEPKAFPLFRKTLRLFHFLDRPVQMIAWIFLGLLTIALMYFVFLADFSKIF